MVERHGGSSEPLFKEPKKKKIEIQEDSPHFLLQEQFVQLQIQ